MPDRIDTDVVGLAQCMHGTEQGFPLVGQRAQHRDAPVFGQWQHAIVLQQHHRLARGLARQLAILRRRHRAFGALAIAAVTERVLEQPQPVLGFQHAAHRGVHFRHRHLARAHQLGQLFQVGAAVQIDVDAGVQCDAHRVRDAGGDALQLQLRDGVVVGHDQAIEAPTRAQPIRQQRAVATGGNPVQRNESRHDRARAGIHGSVVGRQVNVAELALGQVRRGVVEAGFHRAVTGEVLDGGHHGVRCGQIIALETAHLCLRHRRAEVRIFAGAFDDASPARIAPEVHHRAECPVHPHRGCFLRRRTIDALPQVRVPGRGHRQRHRKDGAKAVADVAHEPQRDLQPRLHGDFLQVAQVASQIRLVSQHAVGAADLAFPDQLLQVVAVSADDGELADLFLQRHASEQAVDEGVHCLSSERRRRRCRRGCLGGDQHECGSSQGCEHRRSSVAGHGNVNVFIGGCKAPGASGGKCAATRVRKGGSCP
jgi:hypothetical protein